MTGSLSRAFHLGCPGERLMDISRSPVDFHLVAENAAPAFRQLRETKWTQIVR